MPKLLRNILLALVALVTLVVATVLVLFFVIDPNQYRAVIEEAVYDATGLELNIAGDLSLSLQPYTGITLTDLRLRNPSRPQELASSSLISLRVDPMALLGGQLLVEELRAEDFHVNWYVDAEGNSLWWTGRLAQLAAEESGEFGSRQNALATRFSFIAVDNASVDIQDQQRGYYYSLRNLDFDSQNSNLDNRPFGIQASFELVDHAAPAPWPFTFASTNRIDLDTGEVEISSIRLALTPALLEGNFLISDLFGDFRWQGEFYAGNFALDDLLDNLRADASQPTAPRLPGISTDPAWQLQFQLRLAGDAHRAGMPELTASLGDMRLEMDAELRLARDALPGNLRFDIKTNDLDLTPYLPDDAEPPLSAPEDANVTAAQTPAAALLALEIPDDPLTDLNVQGAVAVDSLFVNGVQFGSIILFANVESGLLDLELQPTPVLDGNVAGTLRINSVPADSVMTLALNTRGIDIGRLPLPMIVPGTLAGRLDLEARYSGQGDTVGEWLDSFSGAGTFAVADNAVDIGVIKQVFTSIAALSPTGDAIQQWPDVIRFGEFSGFAIFDDGLDDSQQIRIRFDNFDISGTGGLDLDGGEFDYQLLFTVLGEPFLQTIPIGARYHNVAWPVQCSARFDDPVNRYCRPDLVQVRELFTRLPTDLGVDGLDTAADPLDSVTTDQAPELPQDSSPSQDSRRGLLRDLFRN